MFGGIAMAVEKEVHVISITPDLALEQGYTYAGGLGVLEGDKLYAAGKIGMSYTALSLLYRNGYVDYEFDSEGNPKPKPQPQPQEFISVLKLVDKFTIGLRGSEVSIEALEYGYGSSKVVFFNVREPAWAGKLIDRIYIEDSAEEKFYKYTILAKASAEFITRNVKISDIGYIDLQEAYTALLPLQLRIPGKFRIVIHTAGIWGHPSFPRDLLALEYGYRFIEQEVFLTEIGLAVAEQAFAVSAKHYDVLLKIFPHFGEKITYVTNGVNVERWMDEGLRKMYEGKVLNLDSLVDAREKLKQRLEGFLQNYKKDVSLDGKFVIVWARRITEYKRPWMVIRLVRELKDRPIFFVLGGKAHPQDAVGLEYMKIFRKLHNELPNVVYVPDYDVHKARILLSSGDLLLFTPFSGLEACGTSYMKAAINGVPSLASRDGGVLEFIVDNVNGWLFGEDIREPIDVYSQKAGEINEKEYGELKAKLLQILELYRTNPERYYSIAFSALRSFIPRASIQRVLREYYPDIIKAPIL
jgi:starch phosphorylase